jgi:GT2 family glycosyltransferase/LmbE family N-acetylglucosaminyl deacetylase
VEHARGAGHLVRAQLIIGDARALGDGPEGLGLPDQLSQAVDDCQVRRLRPGVGLAAGHNELFGAGTSELVLMIDATVCLAPTCLSELLAGSHDPQVGLVEPRHLPIQSRRPYDAGTGATSWASSACCLVRRDVIDRTGGFDSANFVSEGADIDLSWQARLAGWEVRHIPWAAVFLQSSDARGGQAAGRDEVRAEEAKLVLASKYGPETLAEAWTAGWLSGGPEARRAAATRFKERVPGPPGRIAGPNEGFLEELFAAEALVVSDSGPYDWVAPPARDVRDRTRSSTGEPGARPFLSIIVRTQGRRPAELEDNLLSLACQTCQDFEVLLVGHDLDEDRSAAVTTVVGSFPPDFRRRTHQVRVRGGNRSRPLNEAITRAAGRYIAFLDDDDVALGTWVEAFRQVADAHPDAIAWTQVVWQTVTRSSCAGRETWPVIEAPQLFVEDFDLFAHLRQNGTPNCGLAVPVECFAEHGVHFREDLLVYEDWDVVLQLVQLRPIKSTGTVTAVYRRGSQSNSGAAHSPDDWLQAESRLLDDLDRTSFVLRGEYLPALRDALDELDDLRGELDDLGGDDVRADDRGLEDDPGEITDVSELGGRQSLVISPHLDDAVLSCGHLIGQLRECVVLTVFAGDDVDWSELTEWDRSSGFEAGTNVVAARTSEDDRALAALGASGMRLDFLDQQYREPSIVPPVAALSQEIVDAIEKAGADTVFFPIGLGHFDHQLTAWAAAHAARRTPDVRWFAYQEIPYGYEDCDISGALDAIADLLPVPVQLPPGGDIQAKETALDLYPSQMAALGEHRRALAEQPERYWRLTAPVD